MDTQNTPLNMKLDSLLPPQYQRNLAPDIDPEFTQKIIEHIVTVRAALKTYLPRYLVEMISAHPVPGVVSGNFPPGTVLFADVSGFTAMSEQLSVLGKEGAEEITWIVNSYFNAMIKIAERYGGDLIKFGGDALLVFFGGETGAQRAVTAAREMQLGMVDFRSVNTSQGTFPLRMKIGLATGPVFFGSLGDKEKMDYTILGKTLSCMANAEDLASAEQIVACDSTRKLTAAAADYADLENGFGRLEKFKLPAQKVDEFTSAYAVHPQQESYSRDSLSDLDQDIDVIYALKPYLPSELFERVVNNPVETNIYGSHRPVSILFANYYGIEDLIETLGPDNVDISAQLLNIHFLAMNTVIDRYGGTVNRLDSYNIGNRILALFGALRAHEDDPQRAVRAALDMNQAVVEVNKQAMTLLAENSLLDLTSEEEIYKQRIGVNSGFVFAGNTGSHSRREYTVMGDQVNMTARLMSISSSGEVITGQSTAHQTAQHFQLFEKDPVKVKGISDPVRNYQVIGMAHVAEGETKSSQELGMFGRERELSIGLDALKDAGAGRGKALVIAGTSGVGKTRLVEEIGREALSRGMLVYSGSCLSYGKTMPYHPWADILRMCFLLKPNQSLEEQVGLIQSELQACDQGQWTPILGSILGLHIPDNQLTQQLDAKFRRQRLLDLTLLLLTARSRSNPLVIVIEDAHWADPASLEMLSYLIRNTTENPILTLITSRPDDSITDWISSIPINQIELDHLSEMESRLVINDLLGGADLSDALYELIFAKSSGNPFFIGEVVRALVETQMLYLNNQNDWQVHAEIGDIELPESIHGLIISRIDRLITTDRRILQVASIVGRVFAYQVLAGVYPDSDLVKILKARLEYLEHLGITELDSLEAEFYRFMHLTTRDVVYESLPYVRRRELHCTIGEFIERQTADQLSSGIDLLAHHFFEGHSWQKAIQYNLAAAEHAQREFANETAILACERTLQAANNLGPDKDTNPTRIAVHDILGDIYCLIGQYPQALEHYQLAQNLVDHLSANDQRVMRLAKLSRKTAAVYEGMSEFQQAIEWLAIGLTLIEDQDLNIETARNFILHAGITYRMGELDAAEDWCHQTLTLAAKLSERESRQLSAQAYYNLGHISTRRGDMSKAVDHCKQSVAIYQEIDDVVGQARAFNNLAIAYTDQGDYPSAEAALQKSLAINTRIGNVQEQGFIANNLGNIYLYRGDYERALQLYQESNAVWQRIGAELPEAVVTSNIAQVYIYKADLTNVKKALSYSEDLFDAIGSEDFLPELERRWAEYYLGIRDDDKALAKIESSLAVARKNEARLDEGISLRIAGEVYRLRADFEQSKAAFMASQKLLQELDSEYEAARSMLAIEVLAAEVGQPINHDRLEAAAATFTKLGAKIELREAARLLEDQ